MLSSPYHTIYWNRCAFFRSIFSWNLFFAMLLNKHRKENRSGQAHFFYKLQTLAWKKNPYFSSLCNKHTMCVLCKRNDWQFNSKIFTLQTTKLNQKTTMSKKKNTTILYFNFLRIQLKFHSIALLYFKIEFSFTQAQNTQTHTVDFGLWAHNVIQ